MEITKSSKYQKNLGITIAAAVSCIVLLGGCGEAYNKTKCRQAVMEELKTFELQTTPGLHYAYIARLPDGSIWYVESYDGKLAKVSAKTQLFGPMSSEKKQL